MPEAALLPSTLRPMRLLEGLDDLGRKTVRVGRGRPWPSPGPSSPSGRWRCPCPRSAPPSCRRPRRVAASRAPRRSGVRLPRPRAVRLGMRHRARGEDVAQGVAALVAEGGRVGRFAHAQPVTDHDDGAAEGPGHVPAARASQRSAALRPRRRPRTRWTVCLVAEPGPLALRVVHGRRRRYHAAPRRRSVRPAHHLDRLAIADGAAAGAVRRVAASQQRRAPPRSGRAPSIASVRASTAARSRSRPGIEADDPTLEPSERAGAAPAGARRSAGPWPGRPPARGRPAPGRAADAGGGSGSTRASRRCRRASPWRSASASRRRRSASSRAGPSKRPVQQGAQVEAGARPPRWAGGPPRAAMSAHRARASRA